MFGLGLIELAILGALFLLVAGIVTAVIAARAVGPRN